MTLQLAVGSAGSQDQAPPDLDNSSGTAGFTTFCDIKGGIQRSQSFVATRSGTLSGVSFTAEAGRTLKFSTRISNPTGLNKREKTPPRSARPRISWRLVEKPEASEVDLAGSRKSNGAIRVRKLP